MSTDEELRVSVNDFIAKRDALLARRKELLEELALIELALKPLPLPAPKPHGNRRETSKSSVIERFVREHPESHLVDVAIGTGFERGVISTALNNGGGTRSPHTHTHCPRLELPRQRTAHIKC